jgi:hypothetical protein
MLIPEFELFDFVNLFNCIDLDGGGTVTYSEFKAYFL